LAVGRGRPAALADGRLAVVALDELADGEAVREVRTFARVIDQLRVRDIVDGELGFDPGELARLRPVGVPEDFDGVGAPRRTDFVDAVDVPHGQAAFGARANAEGRPDGAGDLRGLFALAGLLTLHSSRSLQAGRLGQ